MTEEEEIKQREELSKNIKAFFEEIEPIKEKYGIDLIPTLDIGPMGIFPRLSASPREKKSNIVKP